jgi:WD40 repeat protein
VAANWKTVRVFISSTFRDMHAERDHLVRVVFPELRERCAQRHLHLVDVDLRWGVTEEDAQRGRALEICLREIEDCRPFFVGLLGERYGWIPPRYDIPDEPQFDSLRHIEPGHSITAMEIYHGVLNNPQMQSHAFFYFRDPVFIDTLPAEQRRDFHAEDAESAEKLSRLKERIKVSGLPVREGYRREALDAFGQQVLDDLWSAIEADYPEAAPEVEPLEAERAYHDFFIENRAGLFIGQRHLLARLHAYTASNKPGPMMVTGTPGCGKSALLARFVSQFRRLQPETFVLYHFVGASPSSTDPRQMLLRLCQELARRFGFEDEIPQDYNELRVRFWQFCQRAAEREPWVLVLDALNQLEETYHAHDLDWLPALVPPGLRLILSSLEGDTLQAACQKYQARQDLIVTSLRLVDQGFIIARQLKAARKSLSTARDWRRQWRARHGDPCRLTDPITRQQALAAEGEQERSQLRFILTGVARRGSPDPADTPDRQVSGSVGRLSVDRVARSGDGLRQERTPEQTIQRETANPLYLKLVAEELRLFGDYDRLAELIAGLPTDVPDMFQTVLSRLEGDHGRALVEHALSLVATGRHGLLEGELLELLARPCEERFPVALWSRLYRGLAFYFKPRASIGGGGEGLIDFFHQQLAKAVRARYLGKVEARLARHAELAGFFQRKGDPGADGTWRGNYPRSLSELVHHQIGGQLWGDLEKNLTTLSFLEANVTAVRSFDLANAISEAVSVLPESRPQRGILKLLEEALRRDIHFIARHAHDYPQGLFQCLWNTCWWYDCPEAAQHYVSGRPPGLSRPHSLASGRGAGGEGQSSFLSSEDGRGEGAPTLHVLLEHWRDQKGESSPGFPWLRSLRPPLTHLGSGQLAVFRGHEGEVTSVSYSPDGARVASASADNTVRVWDARSGAELAVLRGHKGEVISVSYSPDGARIVSGSKDWMLRLWDARSGAELACLQGHRGDVTSVAFTPDGKRIVSGSTDRTLQVWDARSGEQLACLRGHEGPITCARYSSNGLCITSAYRYDAAMRVWDARSGAELLVLRGHERTVTSVSHSPDGERIISGSWDKTLRLWDVRSGAELAVLRGHEGEVTSVSYSPDGARIASGSDDETVRVWDARSGAELSVLRGHEGKVTSVSYSPDGARITSGSDDETVRVWDARSGAAVDVLRGSKCVQNDLLCPKGPSFSPAGDRIATMEDGDHTVRLWDVRSGAELAVLRGHEGPLNGVAFSPDGTRLASGSADETVRVWDARSGAELIVLRGHEGNVNSVAYSADGTRLASGSADETARVWDARNGAELGVFCCHEPAGIAVADDEDVLVFSKPHGWVTSVAFSSDGERIVSASGSDHGILRLWDVHSRAELAMWRGHEHSVKSVSYSPDGTQIASHDGSTLRAWDARSGAERAVFDDIYSWSLKGSVHYSPDGARIACGHDREVNVWNAQSGNLLRQIPGSRDVRAIAAGDCAIPLLALARNRETVVERAASGVPVAWFPLNLDGLTTHPSRPIWTGVSRNRLHIIRLEDGDTTRDLAWDHEVQRGFLPPTRPELKHYVFFDFYRSANHLGGDFYDYIALPDGRTAVVVASVAGHDMTAGMLMATLSFELRFRLASESDVVRALCKLNNRLSNMRLDRFPTLILVVLDPITHKVTIVNAGHMAPFWRRAEGTVLEPGSTSAGLPLGIVEGFAYESNTITLGPGESLLIHTDSVNDAMNPLGEQYTLDRLKRVIQRTSGDVRRIGEAVVEDVRRFMEGGVQTDDLCIVGVGRKKGEP